MPSELGQVQAEFIDWVHSWVQLGAVLTDFERADPTSQHSVLLASDWGLNSNPENLVEMIRADALRRGYTAIWEREAAGGPHLHVQRYRGGFLASCGILQRRGV